MTTTVKPIETLYNGVLFRSRAEARWAFAFDIIGMRWLFENEGFKFSDGTYYLPDFYLPDCKQFFEVKGGCVQYDQIDLKDCHKIMMLDAAFPKEGETSVFVGFGDMTFCAYDESKEESGLMVCSKCGKPYFVANWGSWGCTNCGYYDGDRSMSNWIRGTHGDIYDGYALAWALDKAKSERFTNPEESLARAQAWKALYDVASKKLDAADFLISRGGGKP